MPSAPLIGLALAFAAVLFLIGRRVALALALLVGTIVLALVSRMSGAQIAASVWAALTQRQTVELVLDVAVITSLAGVLKSFGLLEAMVTSVTRLLGGARLAIMAVPSIIGALPVLGGAILSAPVVDGLGDRLGLTGARKGAVNLVFRHAWFYVAPFSPSLVLASQLAGVSLGRLIWRQVPFCLLMLLAGYWVLLSHARVASTSPPGGGDRRTGDEPGGRRALGTFFRSTAPLVVGVVLSVCGGPLRLPLYAAIATGLALALFLARREEGFRYLGLPVAWKSVQWPIVLTMASIMVFGRVLTDSGAADALVAGLSESGLPVWAALAALPATIGFVSGAPAVFVGVSIPVLLPLLPPVHAAAAASALYTSGFLAYFISPLHLCQVLSSQFFGVAVPRLYREYWPVVVALAACTALYVWMAWL